MILYQAMNFYIPVGVLISFYFIPSSLTTEVRSQVVNYLVPNEELQFNPKPFTQSKRFRIYCYEGKPKSILYIWQSIFLQIDSDSEDYTQYDGPTPEIVLQDYEAHRFSWSISLFSWKSKNMKLDPFNQSCIGIHSNENYIVRLRVLHIDYWKVLMLVVGILIYLSAAKLCQNVLFYYISGISIGIIASFLFLIYFLSKLFPRKSIMYGVFATGWTVSLYLLQLIKDNLRTIFVMYREYVVYYTIFSGVISFIVCYRYGPIKDERTRSIIRWSLQAIGLLSIYLSSQFQEASVAQIIVLLIYHNTPSRWLSKPRNYLKRKFPPKVKLLTNDEYYAQGVRETNKSLEELRKYCLSPECNQWKTALKLKDVKRFASFIEGNSHLSDEEVLEYETSLQQVDFTDDEEQTDEEDYTDED
ncbi:nuclear envelope integral membrane protein 1 [Coccinella septempunctata]|uniref:nuclear envelope integral membrane protein 1 n=1 Tax=Coccinella septempunctata TaxID=41139 RepID=UPI001D07BE81|nr:nuclear envelope integral membrane protein 1 [Coccinella septempunctata]